MSWLDRLLHELADELENESNRNVLSMSSCGPETIHHLRTAFRNSTLGSISSNLLDELAQVAYNAMSTSRQHDPACWRRLYTDACTIRSIVDVNYMHVFDEQIVRASIARLDRVLVIAGAPGEGRRDLVLSLISRLQTEYLPSKTFELPFSHSFTPPDTCQMPSTASSTETIPRFNKPPSLVSFQRQLYQQPFILTGYALDWPAMNDHPWHSIDYLKSVAGPGRLVPIEVGSDYRMEDWSQQMMDWDEFLDSLDPRHSERAPVLYLAQHNLFSQFSRMRADILLPDYVYTCPPVPPDYPDYSPPGNEDQLVINAWLGPKGTVSPAHTDPYYNFYAQVVGRKTVWLAAPSVTPYMYPYPTTTSESSVKSIHNPAANNLEPSMSNTSRIDVFASQLDEPEREPFPLFSENVAPNALCAMLEPGDILFFPPGWWHAMKSEETSFSVSMWF